VLTTANYLFGEVVYVAFRSSRPDIVTWLRVQKNLLENKIDIRQLVKWPTPVGSIINRRRKFHIQTLS